MDIFTGIYEDVYKYEVCVCFVGLSIPVCMCLYVCACMYAQYMIVCAYELMSVCNVCAWLDFDNED